MILITGNNDTANIDDGSEEMRGTPTLGYDYGPNPVVFLGGTDLYRPQYLSQREGEESPSYQQPDSDPE